MKWVYTRLGLGMFLVLMVLLTIVGCSAVHDAIKDYQFAYADSSTQAAIAPVANGIVMLLASVFPEFKSFGSVIGFGVTSVLTFLSGLLIGKKRKKGSE